MYIGLLAHRYTPLSLIDRTYSNYFVWVWIVVSSSTGGWAGSGAEGNKAEVPAK